MADTQLIDMSAVAEEVRLAMPRPSDPVDRFMKVSEWELALAAALVVFAQENEPLPPDLRRKVELAADTPGLWYKFARSIREKLAGVPR